MHHVHDSYYENQILTAPPQQLRLMLIDGAIRFGKEALELWDHDQWDAATEAFARCRDIVEELLQSIQTQASPLAKQVSDLYNYLFRLLAEAQIRRDRSKMDEFLSLFETERETWRLVCEQATDTTSAADIPTFGSVAVPTTAPIPAAHFAMEPSSGISFEA